MRRTRSPRPNGRRSIIRVGLVALDEMLPDGDGAAGVSRILRVRPDARVVILTMVDDEDVLRRA